MRYIHYWVLEVPKEKPNVGYWPRGTSTSKPYTDDHLYIPRFPECYEAVREAEENYAYHRHQQQMTDDFRAKLHFANRVLTQRTVTIADYYEWNANVPEEWCAR